VEEALPLPHKGVLPSWLLPAKTDRVGEEKCLLYCPWRLNVFSRFRRHGGCLWVVTSRVSARARLSRGGLRCPVLLLGVRKRGRVG